MSSTYIQATYQVVFATKYREPTLLRPGRPKLLGCIAEFLRNKRCIVHAIGGVEDHLHLVFGLHPSLSIADLVKDVKLTSSKVIKTRLQLDFPTFGGWQRGYGAFTYPVTAIPNLKRYVQNQEQHHQSESSDEELRRYLAYHDIPFDERYFA